MRLTAAEHEQVEHTFKTTTGRRLRERCQAVLMASQGRKWKAIAQDLGVHRTPVRRWLDHYAAHGLDGLVIHWAPGKPARLPLQLAPTIGVL
jgi:transposase